jgi:hypothetical protein
MEPAAGEASALDLAIARPAEEILPLLSWPAA